MALDAGLVGRSYPPSAVYEVGRVKIAEFAAALGCTDPVHTDVTAARAAAGSRYTGSGSPSAVANSAIFSRPTSYTAEGG